MSIVPLLLFCSLVLVIGSVVLFVFSVRQGDCHEAERMCLMPLEDDDVPADTSDLPNQTSPSQTQYQSP